MRDSDNEFTIRRSSWRRLFEGALHVVWIVVLIVGLCVAAYVGREIHRAYYGEGSRR